LVWKPEIHMFFFFFHLLIQRKEIELRVNNSILEIALWEISQPRSQVNYYYYMDRWLFSQGN